MLKDILGCATAALFLSVFLTVAGVQEARATFVLGDCSPSSTAYVDCTGTVDFFGFDITKEWLAVPTAPADYHQFESFVGSGPYTFVEDLVNNTGMSWTDYHISFNFIFGLTNFTEDIINVSVPATIVQENQSGGDLCDLGSACSYSIFFDEPLESGDGFTIDSSFIIALGETINVIQYPTIPTPEPATLALLGLGFVGLGFARRKKAA